MRALGIESVDICPWALREGLILRKLDSEADGSPFVGGADELTGVVGADGLTRVGDLAAAKTPVRDAGRTALSSTATKGNTR